MKLYPYWLWAVLSLLPASWTYAVLTSDSSRIYHQLLHPTGEMAARALILTLMMTPLAMIFRRYRIAGWLRKSRRYLGVAAFVYAAHHTVFYLIDKASLDRIIGELPELYIWTGWIAFIIFVPLAVTSNDWALRKLGTAWKPLQRWVYAAAVLTLIHWAALHEWRNPAAALVHFAPLTVLELYRVIWWARRYFAHRAVA